MADCKAIRFAVLCIVGMLGAAMWRLHQTVPRSHDWQYHGRLSFLLLTEPLALTFVTAVFARKNRRYRNDHVLARPWRTWIANFLVPYSVIVTTLDAASIMMSLNLRLPLGQASIARLGVILISLAVVVAGNTMPKLPCFSPSPAAEGIVGPIYGPKLLRLRGRLTVGLGVAYIASALMFPLTLIALPILGITVVYIVVGVLIKTRMQQRCAVGLD